MVNPASDAHASARLDFDDLQSIEAYRSNFLERLRYGGGDGNYRLVRNWRTSCSRALWRGGSPAAG
jgi:hypothetical protein